MQWKRNKEQKLRKSWIPDRDYESWKIPYFNQPIAQISTIKQIIKHALFLKNKVSLVQQVLQMLVSLTFVI